jgi:hypothetical protein
LEDFDALSELSFVSVPRRPEFGEWDDEPVVNARRLPVSFLEGDTAVFNLCHDPGELFFELGGVEGLDIRHIKPSS